MEKSTAQNQYGRGVNFGAGPAALPLSILETIKSDLMNFRNSGRSVMELSHRSKVFEELIQTAETNLRKILSIPDNYKVAFMQGGGTGQFAAVPLNFSSPSATTDYVVTGVWSKKATEEAQKYSKVNVAFSSESSKFSQVSKGNWNISKDSSYVYYCDNETINGVEFPTFPEELASVQTPIICDMSSNFISRPVDVSKYGMIFAGAQKNSGISGVTVSVIRDDLLKRPAQKETPTAFNYKITVDNQSLYNTPPTFSIYVAGLVYEWLLQQGGLEAMHKLNLEKSKMIYDVIKDSNGFYKCPIESAYQSRMNIPFRLADTSLEPNFLKEAEKRRMFELAGHRSVGGIRASLYNAITLEETTTLRDFMKEFQDNNQK